MIKGSRAARLLLAAALSIGLIDVGALGQQLRAYHGVYRNDAYGYHVTIPKKLVGYDDGGPDYQAGFVINLKESSSKIYVYAENNSLGYTDPCQFLVSDKKNIGYYGGRVIKILKHKINLDSIDGCKGSVYYVQRKSLNKARVTISGISRDSRFIYTIKWIGPTRSISAGEKLINQLKFSWRYTHRS